MSVWILSGDACPPHLWMCVREWRVYTVQSECVWSARSLEWKGVLASQVPSPALSSCEQLWPPDPELGTSGLGRKVSYLFLFTFLKCTCGSHVFQCFILEVLWVL